ncbi:ABC transporter substrate-binding protein [Thermus antranikianii]|uniref:ABC transporter substrate-binding protein n=1 Tax=Thermus antranikianii TaxID=88190 RepID=UPI001C745558|nr:ABC transporter substrate-binding protein [Thermus antranikianii]QWK21013.1 MAG: ABC transporter substrate-binding protein [Thermus antranikianii]
MAKRWLVVGLLVTVLGTTAVAQKVTVQFWYSIGGSIGDTIQELVKRFNASQGKVEVKAQYAGGYDDAINKLLASIRTKNPPHVVQVYDIGTQILVDSQATIPVQDLVQRDKVDLHRFLAQPLNYYTVNGKLQSMPFNSSTPLVYFNLNALQEAGIKPKQILTFEELADVARKLTKRDKDGKVVRYGIALADYGWFLEQLSYNNGFYYCNNENGRKGRATEVNLDNPAIQKYFQWFLDLYKEGTLLYVGRRTADSQSAFATGKAAITFDSTAVLQGITRTVGGRFRIYTGYFPYFKEFGRTGVAIGGASVWLMKGFSEQETEAAWSFVKWLVQPEQQAFWHLKTGYFPLRLESLELPDVRQAHREDPNYTTAIQQLRTSKVSNVTAGCLMGSFPEIRQLSEQALEAALQGKPIKEALAEYKRRADAALERYNQSVGR